MKYTTAMNFEELKTQITKIAEINGLPMRIEKIKSSDCGDGKISTAIKVLSQQCEITFYDYKMTRLYCEDYDSPTKFRKTAYNWHVKTNDRIMLTIFKSLLEEA